LLRIWFNRTYATNSHVIAMLRANPGGRAVHVIGTHPDPDSPVLAACDQWAIEPELAAGEYVGWALQFAREHGVDLLIPRLHMAELAEARAEFAAAGTRLLCADAPAVRLFADKVAAYRAAAGDGLPVPPYRVVRDSARLRAAHPEFAKIADWVCMKPTSGVGGNGYRRLTTAPPSLADFAGEVSSRVQLEDVCRALDTAEADANPCHELMVMPYLDGPEISVDVAATAEGEPLAAIGRGRSRRRRLIVDDVPAREIAQQLTRTHRVSYLSNTQVRYWQGPDDPAPRAYLLELNTRISGGLFQTALAGVNLPWAAVRLALGEDVEPLRPRFGAGFTTVAALVALP
jgi:biotin carboxylase